MDDPRFPLLVAPSGSGSDGCEHHRRAPTERLPDPVLNLPCSCNKSPAGCYHAFPPPSPAHAPLSPPETHTLCPCPAFLEDVEGERGSLLSSQLQPNAYMDAGLPLIHPSGKSALIQSSPDNAAISNKREGYFCKKVVRRSKRKHECLTKIKRLQTTVQTLETRAAEQILCLQRDVDDLRTANKDLKLELHYMEEQVKEHDVVHEYLGKELQRVDLSVQQCSNNGEVQHQLQSLQDCMEHLFKVRLVWWTSLPDQDCEQGLRTNKKIVVKIGKPKWKFLLKILCFLAAIFFAIAFISTAAVYTGLKIWFTKAETPSKLFYGASILIQIGFSPLGRLRKREDKKRELSLFVICFAANAFCSTIFSCAAGVLGLGTLHSAFILALGVLSLVVYVLVAPWIVDDFGVTNTLIFMSAFLTSIHTIDSKYFIMSSSYEKLVYNGYVNTMLYTMMIIHYTKGIIKQEDNGSWITEGISIYLDSVFDARRPIISAVSFLFPYGAY